MRKYRLIKETNTTTGREQFVIQARYLLFFWTDIYVSGDYKEVYKEYTQLLYPKPKNKYKREEIVINNIYV